MRICLTVCRLSSGCVNRCRITLCASRWLSAGRRMSAPRLSPLTDIFRRADPPDSTGGRAAEAAGTVAYLYHRTTCAPQ